MWYPKGACGHVEGLRLTFLVHELFPITFAGLLGEFVSHRLLFPLSIPKFLYACESCNLIAMDFTGGSNHRRGIRILEVTNHYNGYSHGLFLWLFPDYVGYAHPRSYQFLWLSCVSSYGISAPSKLPVPVAVSYQFPWGIHVLKVISSYGCLMPFPMEFLRPRSYWFALGARISCRRPACLHVPRHACPSPSSR